MDTVREDRNLYIGGSDTPIILGISPFKSRWRLLQEKAGIVENDFEGNEYTRYGEIMEPKIRDHINKYLGYHFEPACKIVKDLRGNTDGWEKDKKMILEIKTTSKIYETVQSYTGYIVQMLFYMAMYGAENAILAVYERPEDFDEEFDPDRLHIYDVRFKEYNALWAKLIEELDKFRADLAKLRENPFITEEEFQPKEVIEVANRVLILENSIAQMKETEKKLKEAKAELKRLMEQNGIKKWTTPNGTQITLVPDGEDTVVSEFNMKRFAAEQPALYGSYLEDRLKTGRAGYVRVTQPKGE